MTEKILHIIGRLVVPVEEFERQQALDTARFFAGIPGLRWKIWLVDRERGEAGGTYLFADENAFNDYVNGPIVAQLREYPLWTDMRLSGFDIMTEPSAITRAPVGGNLPDEGALTFGRMAGAAARAVPSITPPDLYERLSREEQTLVIDVRDAADIAQSGTVPGAINISYGSLTYMADNEVPEGWRDPRLADRAKPIVTTCIMGPLGAMGGKLLHDMGFSDVAFLDGGVMAWQEAGLPLAH